ncbi:probable salivary secreted peptide [Cydia fagiglandana]|uniref:probable salivary secreted peptide n=1 Tax=Cydia fagiglandana TaxID=1458189 RepID=UPI002FEDEA78
MASHYHLKRTNKMRALTVSLSFLCLFAAYSCQSHDLVVGQTAYGDVALYKVHEVKYGFPFFVRTSIIEYPEPGLHNFAYIRAIHIKDNDRDGSGGYPTISAGGIGQRFVKIKLKSQRGGGLNFTVTIYGRY